MTDNNDLDKPVWGAPEIAQVINKTVDATEHMLAKGLLDASKCGKIWVTSRRRLLASLNRPFERRAKV